MKDFKKSLESWKANTQKALNLAKLNLVYAKFKPNSTTEKEKKKQAALYKRTPQKAQELETQVALNEEVCNMAKNSREGVKTGQNLCPISPCNSYFSCSKTLLLLLF